MLLRAARIATFLVMCAALCAQAADPPEAQLQREAAAARLFEIPLYRELATRQVYEALQMLPEEQRRKSVSALRDPKIVQLLKEAVIRSTANTFTVREIEVVRRFLEADEARSIVDKIERFQFALLKEAFAAAIINPELAPLIFPQ